MVNSKMYFKFWTLYVYLGWSENFVINVIPMCFQWYFFILWMTKESREPLSFSIKKKIASSPEK